MKVLALDLALRAGFAFGEAGSQPVSGVWTLPGFSDRERPLSLGGIYSSVRAIVAANEIEIVAIEAPLRLGGRSAHAERSLTMLSGAAQAGAVNGGAKRVDLVAPQTWRKAVLGNGFPDKPKDAAVQYCKLMKWRVTDHNQAEACCLFVHASAQAKLF